MKNFFRQPSPASGTRYWGLTSLLIILLLSGCAAFLVPKTSDPYKRMGNAYYLFRKLDRPFPAEMLIRKSIDQFMERDDRKGLAEAYRLYGLFFTSPAVAKREKHYKEYGFKDETATFDSRLNRAIDYFERSSDLFREAEIYDDLTNVEMQKAWTFLEMGETEKGCTALSEVISAYRKNIEKNPGAQPATLPGFDSVEDYAAATMEKAGCG